LRGNPARKVFFVFGAVFLTKTIAEILSFFTGSAIQFPSIRQLDIVRDPSERSPSKKAHFPAKVFFDFEDHFRAEKYFFLNFTSKQKSIFF